MSIRKYKPYTSSTRNRSVSKFDNISSGKNKVFSTGFGNKSTIFSKTKMKPEKSLTSWVHRSKGRNNRGIITSRHIGGGHKKLYRKIDFKRTKIGIPARVICIEYDPNRNSYIALLHYTDGEKKYIICPDNLKLNEIILADIDAPLIIGNSLPLLKIPLGTEIHNIELYPGSGGQLVRAAGTFAKLTAKKNNFVTLTLPSKEMRDVPNNCWATIGQVGNTDFSNLKVGKAGRKRWLGKRPHVRGVVMNPVDHPHGGGEGRAPIGRSHPVTPWGKPTLGHRTRKSKKYSQRFIVRRRF